MDVTTAFLLLLLPLSIALPAFAAPESLDESPDFFSATAKGIAEELRKQIMTSLWNETTGARYRRDDQQEGNEEWPKPEMHFSTLRDVLSRMSETDDKRTIIQLLLQNLKEFQNLVHQTKTESTTVVSSEASGSGIPSPTMFVGGFSFMMMPTPEGEQIFNRIMQTIPNLGGGLPGKK